MRELLSLQSLAFHLSKFRTHTFLNDLGYKVLLLATDNLPENQEWTCILFDYLYISEIIKLYFDI